ncbi:MAG: transketolase [Pseudonocardia sp.]
MTSTTDRPDLGAVIPPDVYDPEVNALRFLSVDAINLANSGHPGTPLDIAPVIHRLFTTHLRHDPADPGWPDRDRFVLSGGHACMVLYAALYLSGYDVTLADLKTFRRLGSRCAGHPERGLLPGVEITTGPLGQGVANAVGMALAERMLAARFNRDGHRVVGHRTWATCGDGDLMEGVAAEACALAGHLGLGGLTLFYDDNDVTLDGPLSWSGSEEVAARFLGYGWHVVRLDDVDDHTAVDRAVADATSRAEQPSIVIAHSHIGIGTPLHDDHRAHGSPIGPGYADVARELLHWPHGPFDVPDDVRASWRAQVGARAVAHTDWQARFAAYRRELPEAAAEFDRVTRGRLPEGWDAKRTRFAPGTRTSTREAGGVVLNALAERIPELVGGAADVESSTKTRLELPAETAAGIPPDVERGRFAGRTLHFGIREHAMGAMVNGMLAHGGLRPFGATFFCFSDYLRPAVRLSALMQIPAVWVFTHDSIGLGEDGGTHQPVEHLASLRAMPGLLVLRPADANETALAWRAALANPGPTALVLCRQDLPVLDPDLVDVAGAVIADADGPDVAAIVATGSEVEVALGARDLLAADGIAVRVVSLPSWELFRARPPAERESILPAELPTVAVEAAAELGWAEFADRFVGMRTFGASGRAAELYAHFGITPAAVAAAVRELLAEL